MGRTMQPSALSFTTVTELSGSKISKQQLRRLYNRYAFAATFCGGKDVLEVACGTGQGLGYLSRTARRVIGLDIDSSILSVAKQYYSDRISLLRGDAQHIPILSQSIDRVICFEAIYYIPNPELFISEVRRILKPDGMVIICTANKDLEDFNPSPFSNKYFNLPELKAILDGRGFNSTFYAEDPLDSYSLSQRIIKILKRIAVKLDVIPKTMKGKEVLKRIFFGKLVDSPAEIYDGMAPLAPPVEIDACGPNRVHRVLYCVGKRSEKA
jgi:ubiquinone/menaquinone biosynthesis C-methylase UbiE